MINPKLYAEFSCSQGACDIKKNTNTAMTQNALFLYQASSSTHRTQYNQPVVKCLTDADYVICLSFGQNKDFIHTETAVLLTLPTRKKRSFPLMVFLQWDPKSHFTLKLL